ncbi:MAG: hypothetical protein H6817_04770 [Phycisphaerales bacterium]|nr:hypothetical protein [Phycisphaerales bacterium]
MIASAANAQRARCEPTYSLDDALDLKIEIVEINTQALLPELEEDPGSQQLITAIQQAKDAGVAKVRYAFHIPFQVGEKLVLTQGEKTPFLRGRMTTANGTTNSTIEYEDNGCKIHVNAQWLGASAEDGLLIRWGVQLSDMKMRTGVEINEGVQAPLFVSQNLEFATATAPDASIAFRFTSEPSGTIKPRTIVMIAKLAPIAARSAAK